MRDAAPLAVIDRIRLTLLRNEAVPEAVTAIARLRACRRMSVAVPIAVTERMTFTLRIIMTALAALAVSVR